MNLKSEQLRADLSIDIELDQPLTSTQMIEKTMQLLGVTNCDVKRHGGSKYLEYRNGNKKTVLLIAAVTYLGGNGQHPIFKKRIQLKQWYKEIWEEIKNKPNYDMKFLGLYHYKGNIIYVDFEKSTYLKKKMNNSAAHVYINDMYQAMKYKVFSKTDGFGNVVTSINSIYFKDYLDSNVDSGNDLLDIFEDFNNKFPFSKELLAEQCIVNMHKANWNKWKETEWAGWYLEYLFDDYIKRNKIESQVIYIGSSNKAQGQLDFDLYFPSDSFYGDLKASDINKKETPANDQTNFIDCINKTEKFWYVIYEHATEKDTCHDFQATKFRSNYLVNNNAWPKNKPFDELSYSQRMKYSVNFKKMMIIELNRVNFREALSDFNQGRQPDGSLRNPKYKIDKKNIENFVIYRYIKG